MLLTLSFLLFLVLLASLRGAMVVSRCAADVETIPCCARTVDVLMADKKAAAIVTPMINDRRNSRMYSPVLLSLTLVGSVPPTSRRPGTLLHLKHLPLQPCCTTQMPFGH